MPSSELNNGTESFHMESILVDAKCVLSQPYMNNMQAHHCMKYDTLFDMY